LKTRRDVGYTVLLPKKSWVAANAFTVTVQEGSDSGIRASWPAGAEADPLSSLLVSGEA